MTRFEQFALGDPRTGEVVMWCVQEGVTRGCVQFVTLGKNHEWQGWLHRWGLDWRYLRSSDPARPYFTRLDDTFNVIWQGRVPDRYTPTSDYRFSEWDHEGAIEWIEAQPVRVRRWMHETREWA